MTSEKRTTLSPDDILAWLRDNPRFLQDYPEACEYLLPPKDNTSAGVADFQYYMVQRLKEDRDEVIESAREIVETSRANMNNQARIHRAVLMLLNARSFEDFIRIITLDFTAILNVDIAALIVEAEDGVIPHVYFNGVRLVQPGTVQSLLGAYPVVLQSQIKGMEEVYGSAAGLVHSQALLRLNINGFDQSAMLAFGSRNPDMFESGQGTELAAFLAGVVERCFDAWLNLSD